MTAGLPAMLLDAAVCGTSLASVAASFVVLWRAQALLRAAGGKTNPVVPPHEAAMDVLQKNLEALQSELQDVRRQGPPLSSVAGPARACLNLERRSQALRLHRRGEPPTEIATMLGIPRQEVELLLKVHRIVMRSI